MNAFFAEVRSTILPGRDPKHGPLPPLLVSMTLVTGLVDAFSYLALGHVFVANMTGNVVFLAFALAGAPGFSIPASAVAVGSFSLGALIAGRLGSRHADNRGQLLRGTAAIQTVFLAASVVLAALTEDPVPQGYRFGLIVVLGIAMGIQNGAARKLAVPDLTTTVLTMTLTGLSADSAAGGATGAKAGRRLISIAAMLLGALAGAELVVHGHIVVPLAIAAVIVAVVAVTVHVLERSKPTWLQPGSG